MAACRIQVNRVVVATCSNNSRFAAMPAARNGNAVIRLAAQYRALILQMNILAAIPPAVSAGHHVGQRPLSTIGKTHTLERALPQITPVGHTHHQRIVAANANHHLFVANITWLAPGVVLIQLHGHVFGLDARCKNHRVIGNCRKSCCQTVQPHAPAQAIGVAAFATIQLIAARTALQCVIACMAIQAVFTFAANQLIMALLAIQGIVTSSAFEHIVAFTAMNHAVFFAAFQSVVIGRAMQHLGTLTHIELDQHIIGQ